MADIESHKEVVGGGKVEARQIEKKEIKKVESPEEKESREIEEKAAKKRNEKIEKNYPLFKELAIAYMQSKMTDSPAACEAIQDRSNDLEKKLNKIQMFGAAMEGILEAYEYEQIKKNNKEGREGIGKIEEMEMDMTNCLEDFFKFLAEANNADKKREEKGKNVDEDRMQNFSEIIGMIEEMKERTRGEDWKGFIKAFKIMYPVISGGTISAKKPSEKSKK